MIGKALGIFGIYSGNLFGIFGKSFRILFAIFWYSMDISWTYSEYYGNHRG